MKIPSPVQLQYKNEWIEFRFVPNNHQTTPICNLCGLPTDDMLGKQIGHWESETNIVIYLHYYHAPYIVTGNEYRGSFIELPEGSNNE